MKFIAIVTYSLLSSTITTAEQLPCPSFPLLTSPSLPSQIMSAEQLQTSYQIAKQYLNEVQEKLSCLKNQRVYHYTREDAITFVDRYAVLLEQYDANIRQHIAKH